MSVARGLEPVTEPPQAQHEIAWPPLSAAAAHDRSSGFRLARGADVPFAVARIGQAEPTSAAAWAAALRLHLLPATGLGAACGALLVARTPGVRPAVLSVAVLLVVAGHGLAVLVRDLGDARPGRAGQLSRRSAGRAALALSGVSLLLAGALVAARGPVVLWWALAAVVVVAVAVSRRSGPVLTAVAGFVAGSGSLLLAVQAGLGSLPVRTLPPALAAGGLVAAVLLARRHPVRCSTAVRLLVALPLAASGAGVAVGGLPVPVLGVALALPSARRAADRPQASLLPAARLTALLLFAALVAGAVLGLPAR